MRCEDVLFFKDNFLALQFHKNDKCYKPEQIAHQIDEQKKLGYIETGLQIKEKNSHVMKYVFYLKDYSKRIEEGKKSAICIYTSKDFYDEYNAIYVLLNRNINASLEVQNINEFSLTGNNKLTRDTFYKIALDLPRLFKKMREKRLERQLEESLLEETISFCM